ncbi:ATP-binding protein [Kitasatospora sp. NPDC088548]|uniref:ATP-binding protein n=1 Tax=Kitasatospora sp. NPDC088548 TaxID=3364075 RepID=UPI003817FFC1
MTGRSDEGGGDEMMATIGELTLPADDRLVAKVAAIQAARSLIAKGATEQRQRGGIPAEEGPLWTRPREYQQSMYETAWLRSLERARHTGYLRHHLVAPHGELPTGHHVLDGEQYPAVLAQWVDRLAAGVPGTTKHVVAFGRVGSGKTAAVIATGSAAVRAGIMTRYVKHSDYVRWLRPDGAPAGMTPVQVREFHDRCSLLIMDELCGEMDGQATEFIRRETVDLFSARMASGLPTIVATNLRSEQIAQVLGDRFISRLGESAMALNFKSEDRRRPTTW